MKTGSTIKALRKTKAWSQAHLAEAAALSVRTIQRVEQTGQCSDETLLALAGAFDVDVAVLRQAPPPTGPPASPLWLPVPARPALLWGAALLAPSAVFILSNVLKYELGRPLLYDTLAALGAGIGLDALSGFLLSPWLLVGGPVLAVLMSLMVLLRIDVRREARGLKLEGVHVTLDPAQALLLVGALLSLAILVGYATMENMAEWLIALTGR